MIIPKTSSQGILPVAIKPRHNKKGKQMIIAEIPKDVTFDLPEGRYRARISKLKPFKQHHVRGPQDWLRILFEVHVPGLSERVDTMAGRSFKLDFNTGAELRTFLTDLLGKKFFQNNAGGKIDLDPLLNTECEVELVHHFDDRYEKPLVIVAKLQPIAPAQPAVQEKEKKEEPVKN